MPHVTIIGMHPLDYSDEVFDQAVTVGHGLIALNPDREKREFADLTTRQAFRSIVLVEMLVKNRDKSMYMGDFGQTARDKLGPDDPVAYEEVFLSLDGQFRIGDYLDQVQGPDVRFAFFLHDHRPGLPIQ
ncbi:MAG TPA: hypothetical protein VNT79_03435, partial [Phycisphaerae bacterium]|nr:hypothetical protein [Phycisphaerae bacterium]